MPDSLPVDTTSIVESPSSNWITGENSMIPTLSGTGQWWPPAYYVFIFSVVLTIIMSILLLVKRYKLKIVFGVLIFTIFMVYLQTRTSTCLWKGGCRIFGVIYLIQPILLVVLLLFMDICVNTK